MAMTSTTRSKKSREKSKLNGLVRFRIDIAVTQEQHAELVMETSKLIGRIVKASPQQ